MSKIVIYLILLSATSLFMWAFIGFEETILSLLILVVSIEVYRTEEELKN